MQNINYTFIFGFFLLLSFPLYSQTNSSNSNTGAGSWSTQAHGVFFSLTQILPEQAQAFYVNRGFTLQQIEPYISSCIYMTVLRNDSAPEKIHFITKQWPILFNNKQVKHISVNDWIQRLGKTQIKKSALIAFRWAQFPPEQEYEPGGDWNQGMLSINVPKNSTFDITAKWDINGKTYETKLQGVHCAK